MKNLTSTRTSTTPARRELIPRLVVLVVLALAAPYIFGMASTVASAVAAEGKPGVKVTSISGKSGAFGSSMVTLRTQCLRNADNYKLKLDGYTVGTRACGTTVRVPNVVKGSGKHTAVLTPQRVNDDNRVTSRGPSVTVRFKVS